MKEIITKNEKSLTVLNEMVSRGFYKGTIEERSFELKRNHFPMNYVVIGFLIYEDKYVLKSDFEQTMRFQSKVFYILSLIFFVLLLIKTNWPLALTLVLFCSLLYILKIYNAKKELKLFLNKYLELYKIIHKES